MTTKRIRCSCGRVYDPVKRPACPDCGAPHVMAEPAPEPVKEARSKVDTEGESSAPSPTRLAIKPQWIAIGAGVILLLVIVFALSRCSSKRKEGEDKHASAASPSPTAVAAITPAPSAAATPVPTSTVLPTQPPRPPPVVTPPPIGGGNQFVPGLTSDLGAMIASAEPGATVRVPPGVYPGGLVITKAIRLVGTNGQVFVQSEGRESLTVRAPGVVVQNIQFSCNGIGELPAISVADGAELELEGCKVQSATAVAVTATGRVLLKTLGCSFTATNGLALRLTNGAHANFIQSSFSDSRFGLWLAQGAAAELHSCAFERDGGQDAKGAIVSLNNPQTALTAEDCHFMNNPGGISVLAGAALTVTNCSFKENGITPRGGVGVVGLISLYNNATATIKGSLFESNQQGVSIGDGSKLEITKCQFSGSGVQQTREVIPSCQPISVFGKGAVASIRESAIFNSAQYGAVALAGGKIELEETEIAGTRSAGLVVGDRSAGAGEGVIRRCRFRGNGNGIGVFAASSATVEESEFRENQDGIIVLDKDSRLRGSKLKFVGNRDAGLFVHALGETTLADSDFQNNGRGAVAGVKGKSAERAVIALEDCRFSGSRIFAAGACSQSAMTLTRCTFDGTDKQNVFKERSATVQMDAPASPSPSPSPSAGAEESPSSENGQTEASPSPAASSAPRARSRSTPRPRRARASDAERFFREIFGPR